MHQNIPLKWEILRLAAPQKSGLFVYSSMEKQRVIVYIDGFNFYYGLKHNLTWKKYYWIDIAQLFEQFMRPDQELVAVKYFSAVPTNQNKSHRQDLLFQANKENPKFKLVLGKYLQKDITCFKCQKVIHTFEEKETDVRIATDIVADVYKNNCDISIIVSADSDMIPAIELAIEAKHKVFIYFPPNQYSSNLSALAGGNPIHLNRYETRFKRCILPDEIILSKGFKIQIPPEWKAYQPKAQSQTKTP